MLCEIESGLCTLIFLHIVLNAVWNFCVRSQHNARYESQLNLLTQSIGHDIPSSLTTRQSLCPTWIPIDYLYTELMGVFTGRYHRCGLVMGWKLDNERALVFISIIEMPQVSWYLKWPVTRMFVQHLVKDIKTPYHSERDPRVTGGFPNRKGGNAESISNYVMVVHMCAPYTCFVIYPYTEVMQSSPS